MSEHPDDFPRWKVLGGQLYHYRPDPEVDETVGDDDSWKVVVPREQRKSVLRECHDEPSAGHLGREKTYDRLTQYYFWPKSHADVRRYVRKCLVCQSCKVEQRPPAGLMGGRTISKPWQVVAADVTGPLSCSKHGHEYILVFQDLFTR
ncbi:hypothetical protein JGE05_23620, partial [Salmonella enterica subsp. enterica serovar Corvallis]|nr:hypothetical protein [Salmonella enterica subsp. enterica serovar Corvallis]